MLASERSGNPLELSHAGLKTKNRDELLERGLVFTTTRSAVTLAGASATAMCAAV